MAEAKILIADDNPVNLSVLRTLLRHEDFDLVAADTGESVLDLARANPNFDLLLLDVVMPGMDGIEVCRQLKADPRTSHIPILLVSALSTDEESIRRGLDSGAEGYLTQPIEDVALRAWVRATLRISRLERELRARASDEERPTTGAIARFAKLSHAVNNPLQALYASADLLLLELADNESAHHLVQEIIQNAERVATLVAEASILAADQSHMESPSAAWEAHNAPPGA